MAESNLSLEYDDYREQVAFLLGYGRTSANWTTEQTTTIQNSVDSGLRNFYYPPVLPGDAGPHSWSFLKLNGTVTLSPGNPQYEIDVDYTGGYFGNVTTQFTDVHSDPNGGPAIINSSKNIAVIPDDKRRALDLGNTNVTGTPEYVSIVPQFSNETASVGQTWDLFFFPRPDTSYTVTYTYAYAPPQLDSTNTLPMGGSAHTETILYSMLADAERKLDDQKGVYWDRFMERLSASVAHDREIQRNQAAPWPTDDQATDLRLTYYDFIREVGGLLGYGWDRETWTDEQRGIVDSAVQSGVRQFYYPATLGQGMAHEWSFLEPLTTITLDAGYSTGTLTVTNGSDLVTLAGGEWPTWVVGKTIAITPGAGGSSTDYVIDQRNSNTVIRLTTNYSGTTETAATFSIGGLELYDLPEDVVGIDGDLTYVDTQTGFEAIPIVSEGQIRALRQNNITTTGRPKYAAVRPKKFTGTVQTKQELELLIWPIPDSDYELSYTYSVVPGKLTRDNPNPYGSVAHGETILQSCLAVAEHRLLGRKGVHWERFMERLTASITMDNRSLHGEFLGYNGDNSDHRLTTRRSRRHLNRTALVTYTGA